MKPDCHFSAPLDHHSNRLAGAAAEPWRTRLRAARQAPAVPILASAHARSDREAMSTVQARSFGLRPKKVRAI
jgi:hypothetical protein